MLSCGTKVSAWASWSRKIKRVSSGLRSEIHPPPSPPWDIRLPEIGTEHERASAEKQAVVCVDTSLAGSLVCACAGGDIEQAYSFSPVWPRSCRGTFFLPPNRMKKISALVWDGLMGRIEHLIAEAGRRGPTLL